MIKMYVLPFCVSLVEHTLVSIVKLSLELNESPVTHGFGPSARLALVLGTVR